MEMYRFRFARGCGAPSSDLRFPDSGGEWWVYSVPGLALSPPFIVLYGLEQSDRSRREPACVAVQENIEVERVI